MVSPVPTDDTVGWSVCMSVCLCLSHSRSLLWRNEMPFSRETCVITLYVLDRGSCFSPRNGEMWGIGLWVETPNQNLHCKNCSQTVTDSGMVKKHSGYRKSPFINALSNGNIADTHDCTNITFAAMTPSAKWLWPLKSLLDYLTSNKCAYCSDEE